MFELNYLTMSILEKGEISMTKLTNTAVIELYDGWETDKGVSWRKGVVLRCQANGDLPKIVYAIRQKLEIVKDRLTQDGLLKYWYSNQVGGLMIVLSQNQESGFKSVPRLQPCLTVPRNARYLFTVFLGPENGSFSLEGYELKQLSDKGVVQQFVPISQSSASEKSQ